MVIEEVIARSLSQISVDRPVPPLQYINWVIYIQYNP